MKPAVRASFVAFTVPFEGSVSWMYLDILGLVTTGRGNLIDPVSQALGLPWKQTSGGNFGADATQDQIVAEWTRVKGLQVMAKGGGYAFSKVTTLRLHPDDVDALTFAKADEMWAKLLVRFPGLASWPCDAQLGVLSMAWAMGPMFAFPHFAQAANDPAGPDFVKMSVECIMTKPPVPAARNAANVNLFLNASRAADPDVLYWPSVLPAATVA